MDIYVGTSGWLYDWNQEGSLEWYVNNSGLNSVELNASFYRFPFRSQVISWARKGKGLRWSVKVNRSITHVHRLNERALEVWSKFRDLLAPLDSQIDFYLFQMPPSFAMNEDNIDRVRNFFTSTGLGARAAVEFRHSSWLTEDGVKVARDLGVTFVSVDSPMATFIRASNGVVYLRMHGRSAWYAHNYTEAELLDVAKAVVSLRPTKAYVFFNNDHWMLDNARFMMKALAHLSGTL